MTKFSPEFLLGASTAAHQVEGNNTHSDYWAMEKMVNTSFAEPSGDAVDHYNRYEEDIRLMAEAGLNCYRFSIEWARIEPEEGHFDEAETEHYRNVIRCCRENGIEPLVTLHHFTSPVWVIAKGGWKAESVVDDFARYADYIAQQFGSELKYVVTINEANMALQIAHISERYIRRMMQMAGSGADSAEGKVQVGINLQQMMERQKAVAAENVAVFGTPSAEVFVSQRSEEEEKVSLRAHAAARDALKKRCPHLRVGLSLSIHDIQAIPGGESAADKEWYDEFLHYLPWIGEDDFLGVQNYTRSVFGPEGLCDPDKDAELTQMEYEYYPEALEHVIRRVAEAFHGDLIVTENGIATDDDARRVAFIESALNGVSSCVADGLPVKGYCYWSLLDNFEWQKGFSMTFGLIAVDRATQERFPKPSLAFLGSRLGKAD